jgi:hypothetical protein
MLLELSSNNKNKMATLLGLGDHNSENDLKKKLHANKMQESKL